MKHQKGPGWQEGRRTQRRRCWREKRLESTDQSESGPEEEAGGGEGRRGAPEEVRKGGSLVGTRSNVAQRA